MRQLKISKSITNRESQSIEKYLQEIGKLPLLTAEQEVALAKRIRKGDEDALETLVNCNLRFVVSVAKQYQNSSMSLNDLINEGNLGLVKAAHKFDETKGFKFISYAVWWIRQSIIQALAEQSRLIRLPLNKVGSLTRINKAFIELEQKYEREPSPEELAELLNLELEQILSTLGVSSWHVSMDAPFDDGQDANSLIDVLPNNDELETDSHVAYHGSLSVECGRSLATLTERERDIVKMFFGIGYEHPYSLEDIGGKFDLTRERVRQIKDKAINKLKSEARSKQLKSFLG